LKKPLTDHKYLPDNGDGIYTLPNDIFKGAAFPALQNLNRARGLNGYSGIDP